MLRNSCTDLYLFLSDSGDLFVTYPDCDHQPGHEVRCRVHGGSRVGAKPERQPGDGEADEEAGGL